MLVTMKEIVDAADKGGYCVPAPNYANEIQLRAAIDAAEECKSPLILDISRNGGMTVKRENFIDLCRTSRSLAENASVPVCINLDHGSTFEIITQCMHDGCTSVMVDRSYLPYEDNAAQVKELTRFAHALGITVEAELGHVGNNVGGGNPNNTEMRTEEDKRKFYTNPEQAVEYVKETGVDCLAVAVGTVHGLYPEGFKPSVDFDLLAELFEKVPVPLVIHGGSGSGDAILSKMGPYASKLNVASDIYKAFRVAEAEAVKSGEGDAFEAGLNGYKEELKHYIRILGAEGKAWTK